MTRQLIDDARRTAHILDALGSSRTTGENTAMHLLRTLAGRLEKMRLSMEPIVAEMDVWADAPSDVGIAMLAPLPADGPERASLGDLRMMRQEWFGGPEAESHAIAKQLLSDGQDIPVGAFDDLLDKWNGIEAAQVNSGGLLRQLQLLNVTSANAPADIESAVRAEFAERAEEWKAAVPVDQVAWLLLQGCPRKSIANSLVAARDLDADPGPQP